ncbi:sucrase ferredoxin [Arthrobacter sp. StoSoilB22]|uniref:sucrase ferredoxin n=1 Tax=Arthrobacter sp. StoSoilB22 TaxID=2830996 RepID=UPI001CC7ED55|nr:sucrase ferredoxin [Arthrobacter sp. StoSoilB22]
MSPVAAAPGFFCANSARVRGDSMAGTASPGTVWILIEHRAGWPPSGFEGLDLEAGTKALVSTAARTAGARVLLVRRPGPRPRHGPKRWAVLRYESSGAHRQLWGSWEQDADLAGIVPALASPGDPGLPPVILICAHGRHDPCCAVRGRPVGRALGERWPDLVWECSHVGGDRFAANAVLAPDGVYYGGLDAESSVATIESHFSDRIHAEYLRGYTDLSPVQQAAIVAVLARFGPAGRHHYVVTETVRDGELWRVQITGRPPRPANITVDLLARRSVPSQLTCLAPSTGSVVVYEPTSVRSA